MTRRAGHVSIVLALLAFPFSLLTASQAPALRIAAPTDGAYISGPTRIVAVIDAAGGGPDVTRVTFFADGKQVCAVLRPPFECDWDAGARVSEHQIRVVAQMAGGQRLVQTVQTEGVKYAETVDVDVVQVTAVVTTGGAFVKGLRREDFKVYEDDKAQPITNFSSGEMPLELVTAIDVSASMADALPGVKAAAKRFLGGLQPGDQVTVLGFNDNIFTLARRATDQAARVRAIDRMAPWGGRRSTT